MADVFLSYNREDQARARRFAALKDKAVICETLGLHDEARAAIRHLRAADASITLEEIETANVLSFISPETSADMNATFRNVWLDTPPESPEP